MRSPRLAFSYLSGHFIYNSSPSFHNKLLIKALVTLWARTELLIKALVTLWAGLSCSFKIYYLCTIKPFYGYSWMNFSNCIKLCKHHFNKNIYSSLYLRSILMPLCCWFPPQVTTDPPGVTISLSFLEYHIINTIKYTVWLLSLSKMFLRCIHVVGCITILFVLLSNIL